LVTSAFGNVPEEIQDTALPNSAEEWLVPEGHECHVLLGLERPLAVVVAADNLHPKLSASVHIRAIYR